MKTVINKAIHVIVFTAISLLVCSFLLCLSGCYTEKKAEDQTEKAALKFPLVVANVARQTFPCIVKDTITKEGFDSSNFIKSRDAAIKQATTNKKELDRLRSIVNGYPDNVRETCKDYQEIIDMQATEIIRMNGIIEIGLQPVIKWRDKLVTVEDSAKIKIANAERDKVIKDFTALLLKRDKENDVLKADKDAWKGKAKKRWWVCFGLLALFGLIIGYNIKRAVKKTTV